MSFQKYPSEKSSRPRSRVPFLSIKTAFLYEKTGHSEYIIEEKEEIQTFNPVSVSFSIVSVSFSLTTSFRINSFGGHLSEYIFEDTGRLYENSFLYGGR